MWSVYYFLRKYWMYSKKMTRNPCWYQILFFFPQKISKMETKYKKASESLARTFFYLQWEKKKKKLGLETVEHTASTILVVHIVTKNEKTLSIPYWSFGCLQTTWISVGAVLFYFFIFVPTWDGWGLQVRFCHMDIELCWFFLRKSGRYHKNMDAILRLDLCVWSWRIDDPPRRKGREIKDGLCLWSAGLQNPGGKRRWYVYTWLVRSSPPQPSEALTCPHQLTYALLFIQAVRYNVGDGSTITTGGLLGLWQSHWKKNIPKLK